MTADPQAWMALPGRWPRRPLPFRGTASILTTTLLLLMTAGCGRSPTPAEPALRIMPVGDSITQGTHAYGSYRRELWSLLRREHLRVDFIGSQNRYEHGLRQEWRMDPDHEGHAGKRTDELLARLRTTAATHPADLVLIHLGTNDILMPRPTEAIIGDLEAIITLLRTVNPQVGILLARLIPIANPHLQPRIDELNQAIDRLGASSTTPASPVLIIDQNEGFDVQADTVDGLHPNRSGARKMAQHWRDGIRKLQKHAQ